MIRPPIRLLNPLLLLPAFSFHLAYTNPHLLNLDNPFVMLYSQSMAPSELPEHTSTEMTDRPGKTNGVVHTKCALSNKQIVLLKNKEDRTLYNMLTIVKLVSQSRCPDKERRRKTAPFHWLFLDMPRLGWKPREATYSRLTMAYMNRMYQRHR